MICECEFSFIWSHPFIANITTGNSDEVEIRAHGNITLAADVDFDTLRVWYNRHNIAGSREVYLKPPVGVKGSKACSSFCLEIFIHEERVSATL